ncbi:MBL fold metallo-hydrolase [Streptomyces sp. ACA25]|uniref:MBL fold metallo-hydrolase n=1 Tax=Streptomyces sp. ACA25 TaxID=3022596 RepID=UPI002306E0DC|nr:MBL fold metallo-hydrolase [Streptomyces sp. ACA25]MDB1088215.1 MBL fold metallo-hydrolase [Streptomyces sp. ACA25]
MESTWEELAPGVVRRRLPGWDETVGAVAGHHGLLVVDTGASLRTGAELRRELTGRFGQPVSHVVITHPHFDHALGSGAFAGTEMYAAAGFGELLDHGVRETLTEDAVRHGAGRAESEEAADVLHRPQHEVSGDMLVDLGGRTAVVANVGPGHTAHDLVVLVPGGREGPDVVFCGDLVEESGEPQAGPDAQPAWWPGALDRLLALGGEHARYVPGHGAVVDAAFVRAQRDMLAGRYGVAT